MIRTILLFLVAGLAEIGGVYMIWQGIRSSKPILFALLGLAALFLYGLTQTWQVFTFGRTFAAYGSIHLTPRFFQGVIHQL